MTFLQQKNLQAKTDFPNVVAFHCQQCLEKCFKAVIEEQGKPSIKSHDLLRLQLNANIQLAETETILLGIINEVYIDARYPGDMGLMPHGKPTFGEVENFIHFSETIFYSVKDKF